jgi:hypothetical protein
LSLTNNKKAMPRIFISYRRDDAGKSVWRLFDWLEHQFGAAHVFFDREAIAPGDTFPQVLEQHLIESDVLIAVIGPRWLTIADDQGRPRLWAAQDYVAYEVSSALTRKGRVIPLLVDGARMPTREELPPALTALADYQGLSLDDAHFRPDFDKLVDAVKGRPRGYVEREGDRALRLVRHIKRVLERLIGPIMAWIIATIGSLWVPPPPALPSDSKTMVSFAKFTVIILLGLMILPTMKWCCKKRHAWLWGKVTAGSLILGIIAFFTFMQLLDSWTVRHGDKVFYIGNIVKQDIAPFMQAHPEMSKEELLESAGWNPANIWTEKSLRRCRLILSTIYILFVPLFAIALMSLTQLVYCVTSKS